jgi:CubicO group peptidase (beta-lactamase class C family)
MFLNRGAYAGARVLSPASVAEMTRNQIPCLPARYRGEFFPEAGWGVGWSVLGNKKPERDGSLQSRSTISHSGAGGVCIWVDPANELVGVYLSVVLEMLPHGPYGWNLDLLMNAVTAAVVD